MVNFFDLDEIMHGNDFPDFTLDYQVADPMESNHYIQGRSVAFVWFLFAYMVLFIVSRYID
mgnify:CR=1 FL=1